MSQRDTSDFRRSEKSATSAAACNQRVDRSQKTSQFASEDAARLAAIRRFDILDRCTDDALDRITALAARRFGVPIALITIVDADRIWFKSHHGLAVRDVAREPGLCASAIESEDPYIVPDSTADPDACFDRLVSGEISVRFYASVPLQTNDGHNIGTLCVIAQEPRLIEEAQVDDLRDLASIAMDHMEEQVAARHAAARAELMAREIDHRVMNSLQLVSNMLALQSRLPDLGAAAPHLQLAASRVAAVARVHRHFFADNADSLCCLAFLRPLCADLAEMLGRSIEVGGDEVDVAVAAIQPIGLIVNELVTNAAKHGEGLIEVRYESVASMDMLTVSGRGNRLPDGFDPQAVRESLGMRIVNALARQLRGKLRARNTADGRTEFQLVFPSPRVGAA